MPLYLRFRFLGARYHATPWGHHVNEGLVEWPPSPWRLCRALLATGFTKLGFQEDTLPDAMRALLAALSEAPPSYSLPPSAVAHTRHYMPIVGKTTKVFDTFAHVGDRAVYVRWPVDLEPESRALLADLLTHLGYLGRAEAWAEGAVLDEPPPGVTFDTRPLAADEPAPPGCDRVSALAPVRAADYAAFREGALTGALEAENQQRVAAGKKPLSKAARKKREADFPVDLLSCLLTPTDALHKAGWRQPPGTRWVDYARPVEALDPAPARVPTTALTTTRRRAEYVLFALASDTERGNVLPQMRRALIQCELLHWAAVKSLDKLKQTLGIAEHCPELTGQDARGVPLEGHEHAAYYPLDLDRDGRLDHVLVHARGGLGDLAQRALEHVRFSYDRDHEVRVFVNVAAMGDAAVVGPLLEHAGSSILNPTGARVFVTATPFIAPRHLKRSGRNTILGQVRAELQSRGLPEARDITFGARREVVERGFLRFVRERRGRKPPSTRPWWIRLELAEPPPAPFSLGYASHYGLGLFLPAPDEYALPHDRPSPS